jgi:hypothetical protein
MFGNLVKNKRRKERKKTGKEKCYKGRKVASSYSFKKKVRSVSFVIHFKRALYQIMQPTNVKGEVCVHAVRHEGMQEG